MTLTRHADDAGADGEDRVLRIYADAPMADGDAVLLLDGEVCLELQGMADAWDDLGRRNVVSILVQTSQRVMVAIARPRSELRPSDYQLWRDLHHDLAGTDVDLLPVRALPAA
jgi:hypothetical protein